MNIHSIEHNFEFSGITLSQPNGLQGGSYFTRILHNNNPLYIQSPMCDTKNGLVCNGKKTYCDLMYDTNNDIVLNWFENLEKIIIDKLYEKRNLWFENVEEPEDIENAFVSIVKLYKSGKKFVIRVNIAGNKNIMHKPFICYDESENIISPEIINNDDNSKIIPLLEVKGIKFSSKSFQLDIGMRQTMVINEKKVFNSCLIKNEISKENEGQQEDQPQPEEGQPEEGQQEEGQPEEEGQPQHEGQQEGQPQHEGQQEGEPTINLGNNYGLDEAEIIPDTSENINLNTPKDVYIGVWKKAREEAKKNRNIAIESYLRAKQIKTEYMLDDIDDSSDDLDNILENYNLH